MWSNEHAYIAVEMAESIGVPVLQF